MQTTTPTQTPTTDTTTTTAPSTPAAATVHLTINDKGSPAGKLADAEIHFHNGIFAGLKLIGFAIWERRSGSGRNVIFPARAYSVNGERRSFALLRPATYDTTHDAQAQIRDLILAAYAACELTGAVDYPVHN